MPKLTEAQSQAIAGVLTFVLLLIGTVAANAASLGFSTRAVTIIAILVPVVDQALTYLIRGFSSGVWAPLPAPTPAQPPAPPAKG